MSYTSQSTFLRQFPPELARATAQAYRKAGADWRLDPFEEARKAYIAAGGSEEDAGKQVPLIIYACAVEHPEWLNDYVRRRLDRENRYMKSIGRWPPPLARSLYPEIPDDFE